MRVNGITQERDGRWSVEVEFAPFPDSESFRCWCMMPGGPCWSGAGRLIPSEILGMGDRERAKIIGSEVSIEIVRKELLRLSTVRTAEGRP